MTWASNCATGAKRRGGSPERPRKARARSGDQQTSLTQPIDKKQGHTLFKKHTHLYTYNYTQSCLCSPSCPL
ncbi:hypothetical protein [Neobacillus drentensis]|uniref:hypothetical protein n=1 Tax=Neobacillus drentensis TaxID=220684 RepID=UPI003000BFF7